MGPIRIAMWSGPRNISTAMMRSWQARGDADVSDEPLYAHYLNATGLPHPGAAEVIAAGDPDWRSVVQTLTEGPAPTGKPIWFQKHMTHHMLPEIGRDWLGRVQNAFLIRDPKAMVASLLKVTPEAGLLDTGLPQQVELFELVRARTGQVPPVVDSDDVLADPAGVLARLCSALGVSFHESMLSWPAGPRDTDGVWARHWYANVERSTGFERPAARRNLSPEAPKELVAECESLYERLARHRLAP